MSLICSYREGFSHEHRPRGGYTQKSTSVWAVSPMCSIALSSACHCWEGRVPGLTCMTWLSFQSKIHAARSLSEIAIDLTETGTLKTSKLANMGSKGKIISGSSGSLLSSGKQGL